MDDAVYFDGDSWLAHGLKLICGCHRLHICDLGAFTDRSKGKYDSIRHAELALPSGVWVLRQAYYGTNHQCSLTQVAVWHPVYNLASFCRWSKSQVGAGMLKIASRYIQIQSNARTQKSGLPPPEWSNHLIASTVLTCSSAPCSLCRLLSCRST
eukprot:5794855-Pleurochrysis_carterae.AAC.2